MNNVFIYAIKLNHNLEKAQFEKLCTYLSDERLIRINRYFNYFDALRSLIGEILSKYIISKEKKIEFNKIIFETNEYGKPFLKDRTDVHFNVSHSEEWIVVAISSYPIGIDVEKILPIEYELGANYFSKEEYNSLMLKEKEQRLDFFYDLWTLKESYIKAVGKGLSIPLDSFSIDTNNSKIKVLSKDNKKDYYFIQYHIDPRYKFAVCTEIEDFPKNIIYITLEELYREITKDDFSFKS